MISENSKYEIKPANENITAYDEKTVRLWADISGIDETYLDELDAEAAKIAARAKKIRRRVKYGAIVTAAASVSAAVAYVVLKPRFGRAAA